jgi:hypothetical protein
MTERDLRQHFNAPPTFDVGNHLRELGRVFIPALIAAIGIAGVTYLVAASEPDQYQVAVTAKIDSGNVTNLTDVTVNMLAPPFVALSQSKPVLDDILQRSGSSMTSDELAQGLLASVETSPSLVQLSVTAGSPDEARALADAAVKSLDEAGINVWNDKVKKDLQDLQSSAAATAERMAELPDPSPARDVLRADYDAQVQRANQLQATVPTRLGLLAAPGTAVKVAPKPVQQALVVGLASLLVLVELLAFLNGRVGRRANAAWVRRVTRSRGYGWENVAAGAQMWPRTTQILLNKVAGSESDPLVLYPQTSSAAIQFVGKANGNSDSQALAHAVDSDWWVDSANAGRPLAVVVIDVKDSSRKALESSFDALDSYGMPVQVVTISPKRSLKGSP